MGLSANKIGNPEPVVEHRKLYSVLCGDLNGKEIQKRRGLVYVSS